MTSLLDAVRAVRVEDRPLGPGVMDAARDASAGLVYASHGPQRCIHVLRAHDLRPMATIGEGAAVQVGIGAGSHVVDGRAVAHAAPTGPSSPGLAGS